jgi:putative transposase
MPRSLRLEFPGAFYHVMARGNQREVINADGEDRRFFLHALGEACERTGWRVHAWTLMGNHYHLFIETPEANLVSGMTWLQNTYTRRFNVRHRMWGRLFGDRYKAVIVDGTESDYYRTLMDYIHLNCVRAGIIRPERKESVLDYAWSSVAGGYALAPRKRPAWLAAADGLAAVRCADTAAGRRAFVARLDRRAVLEEMVKCGVPEMPEEVDARCSHLRRGWYWGRESFAEGLHKIAAKALKRAGSRKYRSSMERLAHDEHRAEKLLAEGLAAAGLGPVELARLPGSDARKVALARCLGSGTTVSQGWLAERLQMRSAANVSQQLRRADKSAPLPPRLRNFLDSVKI